MKEYLESLEIGEGKVKLSNSEIKSILIENGKVVSTETNKIEEKNLKEIENYKHDIENLKGQIKNLPDSEEVEKLNKTIAEMQEVETQRISEEKTKKEKSIQEERMNTFFNDVKFASEGAKKGIIAEFGKKDFKYDEESKKYQGADEWLKEMKEQDRGSFLSDVANPTFTTNLTTPKSNSSLDDVYKAMGIKEEK